MKNIFILYSEANANDNTHFKKLDVALCSVQEIPPIEIKSRLLYLVVNVCAKHHDCLKDSLVTDFHINFVFFFILDHSLWHISKCPPINVPSYLSYQNSLSFQSSVNKVLYFFKIFALVLHDSDDREP